METSKPDTLNLFYHPKDRLRLTVGDKQSYTTVKPVWAAPLSHPARYLTLLNAKGDEIVAIENPADLPDTSREAVFEELHRRYLTATVTAISAARVVFGSTYWSVESDRGPRDFVCQSLQENAIWLSETHLLLLDVDGNRFEIPDLRTLDAASRTKLHAIL